MKSTLRTLLIGSAAIASAGLASASLSYDYDLPAVSFNSLTGPGNLNYPTLSFAKFDTLGGTRALTGVEFNWTVNSTIDSATLKNDNSGAVVLLGATFTRYFAATLGATNVKTYVDANFQVVTPPVSLNVGQSNVISNVAFPQYVSGFEAIDNSLLSSFNGGGSVSLAIDDIFGASSFAYSLTGSNTSQWTNTVTAHSTGSLAVRYDFTPVPEPGSMLALGCLVGSGAFLRMRRRA